MMEEVATLQTGLDETQVLRRELQQLNTEIIQANEERAQAAEYGLVMLEEKQALQHQYDELNSLYDSTKRELENSANVRHPVHTLTHIHSSISNLPYVWCTPHGTLLQSILD